MAERKYFNMKKDIHPDYRPVVFMDTTTGYQFLSGSTKHSERKQLNSKVKLPTYPCRNFIRFTPILHWPSRSSLKQSGRVDRFNKRSGLPISDILLLSRSDWNGFFVFSWV